MTPRDTVADAHRRYRGAVERAAARIVRDREEASDIASETFLAMLERGPRDRQAAFAWLLKTARNRALNVVRDRQRAERRPAQPLQEERFPEPADARLTTLLAAALARLCERDQAAVLLRFLHDVPTSEIAATLGVSPAAARVIVHRAARRFRSETVRVLAEHHGADDECVARLAKRGWSGVGAGHHGCRPCASVADEVSALAAHSLLPVAGPLIRTVAAKAKETIAAARPRAGGAEAHGAEAVAALLIATALVAAPAPRVHAPAPTATSHATMRPTLVPVAAPVLHTTTSIERHSASASAAAVVEDAEGDAGYLVGPPPGTLVLGKLVRLPDAIDPSKRPGSDIRSFAAYTKAGADGEAESLVFVIGLADDAPRSAMYTVSWAFEGTACTGGASLQTPGATSEKPWSALWASCAADLVTLPDDTSRETSWNVELTPGIGDRRVTIEAPLRSLPDGFAELLRPGRTLLGIFATSNDFAGVVAAEVDRAPDEGGIDYTIGDR